MGGTLLFNLLAGYRPSVQRIFPAASGVLGRVDFETDSDVVIWAVNGVFLSLGRILLYV